MRLPPCFGTMFTVRPAVSDFAQTTRRGHRHFLCVADVGGEVRRLIAAGRIADVESVDRQTRFDAAAAVHREDGEHRSGVDVVVVGLHAGNGVEQIAVAAHARQAPHRLVVERDFARGALHVDDRHFTGDGNGFLHTTDASSTSTVMTPEPLTFSFSRFSVAKPESEKVTVYSPGRRFSMR